MKQLTRLRSKRVRAQRYFLVAVNYKNQDILIKRLANAIKGKIINNLIDVSDPEITACSVTALSTERVKSLTYRKPPKK